MTGGNPTLVITLLEQMNESTRGDLATLEQLLKSPDLARFDSLAHRIKGAAKIIKARPLFACCEALEASCQRQDMSRVTQQALQLATAMEELITAIGQQVLNKTQINHKQTMS
ncbi:Hpt domain-containing protein [Aeromonas sp. NJAU223]|uniref:Hpt domain-containing protein n=1 Tax=Aeromonas sp. NJAU223 TaxID=3115650 RepID=UPI003DA98B28